MALVAYAEGGKFSPRLIAASLLTTQDEIARSVGLGRDAISRKDRLASPRTQSRLREMVEILNRVTPRFDSELLAFAWYRSTPLDGFDGRTAMALVREGHADWVMEYIDSVDNGVFA
ncbi:MAG: hypothetical protein DI498_08115 [Paracoccus denitrificans]|nr:MAG: hypothetical protein DI498_08115 [Paracoccus denitrificans]PZO84478.1 MAG: hypothetical protein DI633_08115 [Paracoccus denitrificans]